MRVPAFEYRRKGWHMLSGVLVIPMVVVTNLDYVSVVATAAFVFILVAESLQSYWAIRIPFWTRQLDRTKREHERFSFASLAFLATIVILLWLAPLPVAFAASAQLALGDGMSALVGRAWGTVKIPYNREKSVQGSLAGFIAGALGAFGLLAAYYWWVGLVFPTQAVFLVCCLGAFCAALAESLPRIQDNVTVPLGAGISMTAAWLYLGLEPSRGELFLRLMGA